MFITAALHSVCIGDLTEYPYVSPTNGNVGDVEMSDVNIESVPQGKEPGEETFDEHEEELLVRDSTAGFADWVLSFFRRVLALYENLPEEGGEVFENAALATSN